MREFVKPDLRAPFLVPSLLYFVLASLFLVQGAQLLWPVFEHMRTTQLPSDLLFQVISTTVIWSLKTIFYFSMSFLILFRVHRTLTIACASVSVLLLPLGTIFGLIFLLWTRRHWPKAPILAGEPTTT
jgi:hypothetical protein